MAEKLTKRKTHKVARAAVPDYITKSEFVRRVNAGRKTNNPELAQLIRPTLDRHIELGGIKVKMFGGNKLIDWNKYGDYAFRAVQKHKDAPGN